MTQLHWSQFLVYRVKITVTVVTMVHIGVTAPCSFMLHQKLSAAATVTKMTDLVDSEVQAENHSITFYLDLQIGRVTS